MLAVDLAEALDALRAGAVIVYPTETVYGLGVDACSAAAIERLLALKGRDATKGMSVLVRGLSEARVLLASDPPPPARALVERFWPGALTIVLAAASGVSPHLHGPSGGVGLRCSSDPVARALLESFGAPITSTSANPSGQNPAATIGEARAYFHDRVAAYVDGGPRKAGHVSTVVEFLGERAYLRRAGSIDVDALRAVTEIDTRRV